MATDIDLARKARQIRPVLNRRLIIGKKLLFEKIPIGADPLWDINVLIENPTGAGVRQSLYIKELEAIVEDGRVAQYRINWKMSFLLEGS